MTNNELLAVLRTVEHNLNLINPQVLQKVYVRNAQASLSRAIRDLEDRQKKNNETLRGPR